MKVNTYSTEKINSGILKKDKTIIDLRTTRWIDNNGTSHPIKYVRPLAFENKNVYFLHLFGDDSKQPHHGVHISLNFWQNQKFLWLQKQHWMQKTSNITWLISIIIALGVLITNIIKK